MTLLLDAGALIAVERDDRHVVALIKRERLAKRAPMTHGGIVAQVWRVGGARQVRLARLLLGTEVVPLDDVVGRRTGALLRISKTRDVIDAALVVVAQDADTILTSDPDDLLPLARAAGTDLELVPV